MADKVWLVTRERHTEDNDSMIVLGIYDNKTNAIEHVNKEFSKTEEEFIEEWEDRFEGENFFNGFAKLHATDNLDECTIKITDFEINKPTFETL